MNLGHLLERNVRSNPNDPAILTEFNKYTWREFDQRVNKFGNALRKLGIVKGDRVALSLPNSAEYLIAYFAIVKLGAIVVPFNIMFKSTEITHIVNNCEPKILITFVGDTVNSLIKRKDLIPSVENIIIVGELPGGNEVMSFCQVLEKESNELAVVDCDSDDIVTIMYTSGTTGRPKGAMLTHGNFCKMAEINSSYVNLLSKGDVFFTGTPFCHIFFVTTVLGPMYKGAAVVVTPRFFPEKALELISQFRVTHFAAVPTMYIYMLQVYLNDPHKFNLDSWRYAQSAGASMPPDYIDDIEESFGVFFVECYGATETSSTVTHGPLGRGKAGSIGLPAKTWQVVLAGDNNQSVPKGAVGEIIVKGPGLFKGYWKMPEVTDEAFVEGWFHTGDTGREDEEGYLYLVGRKKDMIICGGYNVYPREVEDVLYTHPAVLEVAVVGIPDVAKGEIPKAFVTLRGGHGAVEAEIIAFCKGRLAPYKVPREVEILVALPKNHSGKILKSVLINRHLKKEGI